jgi:hypothetical protein
MISICFHFAKIGFTPIKEGGGCYFYKGFPRKKSPKLATFLRKKIIGFAIFRL